MNVFSELASVFLEVERHAPHHELVARLRDDIAGRLSPDAAAAWSSKVEADRRHTLDDLLRTNPDFASGLADRLGYLPGFPRGVAEDAWDAAKGSNKAWAAVETLGIARPGKQSRNEYVRALALRLVADPGLLANAAAALGSAVPFTCVLDRELDEITAARNVRERSPAQPAERSADDPSCRAESMGLLGLALSGGGIRSATFNLGVLQGLACLGLLRRLDYLSTVSGGGYVGGWLAAWIKRHPGGVNAVEGSLRGEESSPVSFLRQYSNYLTPRLGFFSADTWTLVTTWVRNTLLNQTVLVLFLATALLVPHVVLGTQVLGHQMNPELWFLASAALLLLVAYRTGTQLRDFDRDLARKGRRLWSSQTQVQSRIILLALVAGIFAASFLAASRLQQGIFGRFFLLFTLSLALTQWVGGFGRCFQTRSRWSRFGMGVVLVLVAAACAALGAGVIVANAVLFSSPWFAKATGGTWGMLIFGPALLMQSYALAVTLQQGLLGREFPDERREWWSRAGAWVLIYSFGWAIFTGLALLVPFWLLYGAAQLPVADFARRALTLLWAAITAGGVLAAKGADTGAGTATSATGRSRWITWLPVVAPYVFIVGLAALLSLGVFFLLTWLLYPGLFAPGVKLHAGNLENYWCLVYGATGCGDFARALPELPRPLVAFLVMLVGGAAAGLLAWRVDVNEFSMHHFYKNRLVRCYLGGSREPRMRAPNPFTGFDPDDDIPLARMHLATRAQRASVAEEVYDGPYHIINTALNLVTGDNLAWQERRAASFVFTPHYAGYEVAPQPEVAPGSRHIASDGYRPTARYGYPPSEHPGVLRIGGIHLGTALAISGAAANPNMGYHSSAPAAFLMTMFNVRLGWWMGNPRHRRSYQFSSPRYLGLAYLLNELTGNSDDRSQYVNLSDGGHFDNLGIYELVRRRCRWIIVCDAEQDGKLAFGGLGNAIRKCRADFGVDIELGTSGISRFEPDKPGVRAVHCAVGTVHYGPNSKGTLVYLKSSLTGDEPSDVLEYRSRQPLFPHQSTGDQWFDESQFESYRALGQHVAMQVLGPKSEEAWEPDAFFARLVGRWGVPSQVVEQLLVRQAEAATEVAGSNGGSATGVAAPPSPQGT
jgi:hypothetical protein